MALENPPPSEQRVNPSPDEWESRITTSFSRGMDRSTQPDLLPDGFAVTVRNMVPRSGRLITDTGYTTWGSAVRGTPSLFHVFELKDGTKELLLFTTSTGYRWDTTAEEWEYIPSTIDTTLSEDEAAGQTDMAVTSESGFADNDYVGVELDAGGMHLTRVNGTPTSGSIVLDDALPSAATTGNAVVKAVVLNGSAKELPQAVTWTPADNVLFANNADRVQFYDPDAGDAGRMTDLGGLTAVEGPSSPGTDADVERAECIAVVNNQVFLGNLYVDEDTTGAVDRPQRLQRSEVAGLTTWHTGNAGYQDFWDTDDEIRGLTSFGDFLIILRERGINRYEYVGSTAQQWADRATIIGTGVIGKRAWVRAKDAIYFASNDSIYRYRGDFTVEDIGLPIKSYLFGPEGALGRSNQDRSWMLFNEDRQELLFMCPTSGTTPSLLVRYRVDLDTWVIRTFPQGFLCAGLWESADNITWGSVVGTWGEQTGGWDSASFAAGAPLILLADSTGQVYAYDYTAQDDNGTAISWQIVTGDYWRRDGTIQVDALELLCRGGTISVEYSTDHGNSWSSYGTITGGSSMTREQVQNLVTGPTIRFRFSGDGVAEIGYFVRKIRTGSVL
jgi:hypothetical protein